MQNAKRELEELGWRVGAGPDDKSFEVRTMQGHKFHFWPYKGWFQGPRQGRGLKKLIKAGRWADKNGTPSSASGSQPPPDAAADPHPPTSRTPDREGFWPSHGEIEPQLDPDAPINRAEIRRGLLAERTKGVSDA